MKKLNIIKPIRDFFKHLAFGMWLAAGTALAAPANDDFATAIDLTGVGSGQTGSNISGTQTGTNNVDATLQVDEPNPGASNTVWFKWTCPADGAFTYGTTYYIQFAGYAGETAANILLSWNFVATIYQADILTFGPGAVVGGVVANAADIAWTVPFGANLATLPPTFTLSPGATCTVGGSPVVSGSTVNFSGGPVDFTVTAQGVSPIVNVYTVTVTFAPNESALIGTSPAAAPGTSSPPTGSDRHPPRFSRSPICSI
jgi:hypothetical protein